MINRFLEKLLFFFIIFISFKNLQLKNEHFKEQCLSVLGDSNVVLGKNLFYLFRNIKSNHFSAM
jgi:hypothetical protein